MSPVDRCIYHPQERTMPCAQCMARDTAGIGSQFHSQFTMQQDLRITMTIPGRPSNPPPLQPTVVPCLRCGQQHPATRSCSYASRYSEHHKPLPPTRQDVSNQETNNGPWNPCWSHEPDAADRVLEAHEPSLPQARGTALRPLAIVPREAGRDVAVPHQTHPLTEENLQRHRLQSTDFTAHGAISTTVREEPAEDANGGRGREIHE